MKKNTLIEIIFIGLCTFQLIFFFLPKEIIYPLFLLVISLLLIYLAQYQSIKIPKTFSLIYLLLLLTMIISASYSSSYSFAESMEIIKFVGLYLLITVGYNLFPEKVSLSRVVGFLIIAGLFWALAGIVEYTGRDRTILNLGLFEPFHWPTLATSFFLLILPINLAYYLKNNLSLKNKFFFFFTLSFLLIALFMSTTEIHLIVIGFLLVFLTAIRLKPQKEKLERIVYLGLLLSVSLPNLLPSFGEQKINSEVALFQEKVFFQDTNDAFRFSVNSIQKNFWWGIGPGTFALSYQVNLKQPWTWGDYAPNELIQTFVETGVFSFIVESILVLYILILCLRKIRMSFEKKDLITLSFATSILLFILQNSNNFSFRIFPIQIILFIILPVVLIQTSYFILNKKVLGIILLPILGISFFLFNDGLKLRSAIRSFSKSDDHNAEKVFYDLTNRPKYLLNPNSFYWLSTSFLVDNQPEEAISSLKTAHLLEPYNQELNYQIAKTLYLNKQINEAKAILLDSTKNNPFVSPKYYLALANIFIEENNKEMSEQILKEAGKAYPVNSPKYQKGRIILNQTEFFSSLRQIYFSLYKLTGNLDYLTAYYQ